MLPPKYPEEEARLAALRRYEILDTDREQVFDDLTRLTAELLDAPVSVINLVDEVSQWFKSEVGLGISGTPLDISICAHVLEESEVIVVPDMRNDQRFADNPLVTGGPQFRFYAGALLMSEEGYPLGTLCVLDQKPREISPGQKNILRVLAREVMTHMELRVRIREQEKISADMRERDERFRMLARATNDVVWDWDMRTDGVLWNEAVQTGFGYKPEEVGTDATWWGIHIHPEDRDAVMDSIHAVIDGSGDGHSWISNYRFARADGSYADILDRGYVIRDEQGVALRMIGAMQDVSERNQMLREAQRREAREHLINEIGEAVRSNLDPEVMQSILVERLGRALDADRCFVTVVDRSRDQFLIGKDYRSDLGTMAPLAGTYRLSSMVADLDSIYTGRATLVVSNVAEVSSNVAWKPEAAESLKQIGLQAVVNVPLYEDGNLVGALGVGMVNTPRDWTPNEVTLIEIIATQARTAVELARSYKRERNIATQLQESLIPERPPQLPELALAGYYQPALEEAGVGGDFWDVFALNETCTVMVVGDLSGKGLAAASQVSIVRNMLRYALYSSPSIADAVTSLNHILAQQELLTGFATLFVGCYDRVDKTLTYVNCGQEPGLLWRQEERNVILLPPTGAVLGGFDATGGFEQQTLPLYPGDAFALFTDGMTEVGQSRKLFLEIDGVRDLLQAHFIDEQKNGGAMGELCADRAVAALIDGVDAYAGSGVRDDIALLIGIIRE